MRGFRCAVSTFATCISDFAVMFAVKHDCGAVNKVHMLPRHGALHCKTGCLEYVSGILLAQWVAMLTFMQAYLHSLTYKLVMQEKVVHKAVVLHSCFCYILAVP